MRKVVRLCAIFQLCLTCAWMLLLFFAPFMGEYWTTRASLLLFETVTGVGEGRFIPHDKLLRHQERFLKLPPTVQTSVLEGYRQLELEAKTPAGVRLKRAINLLTHQEAPFLQAWFIAGMVLPVLLLLRKEGSVAALWLLPLISACYVLSHFFYSAAVPPSVDAQLFPTEEALKAYEDPALLHLSEYARMQDAWNRYLLTHFAPKAPLATTLSTPLEEAEYQFTLSRVMAKIKAPAKAAAQPIFPQRSSLFLGLFFFWHLCFALIVERAHRVLLKKQRQAAMLLPLNPQLMMANAPSHSPLI